MFPPLANCNHPLNCIVAKLTTREHREELEHSNIKTTVNLSRLDKGSVDRLPITSPKISHAMAIVMEYKKMMEVQVRSDVTEC